MDYFTDVIEACQKMIDSAKIRDVINILQKEKELLLITKEYIKEFNIETRIERSYYIVTFRGDEIPVVYLRDRTIKNEEIKSKETMEIINHHLTALDDTIKKLENRIKFLQKEYMPKSKLLKQIVLEEVSSKL